MVDIFGPAWKWLEFVPDERQPARSFQSQPRLRFDSRGWFWSLTVICHSMDPATTLWIGPYDSPEEAVRRRSVVMGAK